MVDVGILRGAAHPERLRIKIRIAGNFIRRQYMPGSWVPSRSWMRPHTPRGTARNHANAPLDPQSGRGPKPCGSGLHASGSSGRATDARSSSRHLGVGTREANRRDAGAANDPDRASEPLARRKPEEARAGAPRPAPGPCRPPRGPRRMARQTAGRRRASTLDLRVPPVEARRMIRLRLVSATRILPEPRHGQSGGSAITRSGGSAITRATGGLAERLLPW
jgi:hypothetical protein